ncbi:glycosyltransferase family 39 protein [uncultured Dubosiella sp.]|uniref:ArnT family glycosyltransferase n=1 Tax=uncultured Dubosiella sp. TaxID=1937011 RepID=UPI00259708A2|nr:hypothetical protein [uncultured Dubosiella sp.]
MKIKLNPYIKWGGMLLVFCLCIYGAYSISMGNAPDEEMRYQVPYFILEKGYLPYGNEEAIRNAIWGFSYAYTPYFPSLIAVGFMKLFSIFTTSQSLLLFSARLVSVFSGAFTWLICCKIGERLFKKQTQIILFATLVCFLPQFIFLSSYLNNDSFAVMVSGFIIYLWIKGDQENWQYKDCVLLGISIGLCALTYYNAYGFILCSIFFYGFSVRKKQMNWKEIWLRVGIIFVSGFLVAGWFFIRNMILHKGDMLGMKTMYEDGQIFALDPYKPTNRNTPKNLGLDFYTTFFGTYYAPINWFKNSYTSFIGVFGFMAYRLKDWVYSIYTIIFGTGLVSGIAFWIKNVKRNRTVSWNLLLNLLLCIFIPIALSLYYSYMTDFQPQGRYVMAALIPVMIIITYGVSGISEFKVGRFSLQWLIILLIGVYLVLFGYAYWLVMIPSCLDNMSYLTPNMLNIISEKY